MNQAGCPGRRIVPARHLFSGLWFWATLLTVGILPAKALDWNLNSNLSQKLEFDDNIQLSPNSGEAVFGSTSSAGLKATTKNKVGEFSLGANFGYTIFRGVDGNYDSENVNNSANANFTKKMKSTTFNLGASVAQVSTLFSEADDTTITNSDTNKLTYSANASANRKLNETDNLVFSTYFNRSTFDAVTAGLVANDTYGVSTRFTRQVNRTLSGGISGAVDIFEPETGGNTRFTITGNLKKKLSQVLSVSGNAGVRIVVPKTTVNSAATGTGATNSGTTVGYPFGVNLDYSGKTYSASAGFNSSVSPSSGGFLQGRRSFNASASHKINEFFRFGIGGSYSITDGVGSDGVSIERTSYSVSPTLSYTLTRDWSIDFGYQYRFRDTGTTTADANKVFLTLSNSTVLLP